MKTYDLAVIGSGPAGYVGALRAALKGASVAVIENKNLGGICLNEGCIPTKALLDVAHSAHRVNSLSGKGISGSVSVDLAVAVEQKDRMVKKLRGGVEQLLKARKVDILSGQAKITGPGEISVEGGGPVGYKKLLVATGSSPVEIPSLPFDGENIISSREALSVRDIPESMLVVGGGYVGCEFADFFASVGTKVTLVELMESLIPGSDEDASKALVKGLKSAGVEIITGTKVEKAVKSGDKMAVELSSGGPLEVSKILVSVGRKANLDVGDLPALGVTLGDNGIGIDDRCATSSPDVFSAGDVTAKRMLAHVASRQAEVAVENALGGDTEIDYSTVPGCVFTSPEIASVGLSEAAAKEEGLEIKVSRFPYAALGRAISTGDTEGFAKLVCGEGGDVLGMLVVGRGASEIIALGGLAIQVGATVEDLAEMIMMHPTFAEAVKEAADVWVGKPLHTI